jgi:hypothetical protein
MKKCIIFIIALIIMFQASDLAYSCTIFNASDGNKVLVGNNEDGFNTDAKMWFLPGEKGSHGAVFFGFDDAWVQGGMNDQGLFIDWAAENLNQ